MPKLHPALLGLALACAPEAPVPMPTPDLDLGVPDLGELDLGVPEMDAGPSVQPTFTPTATWSACALNDIQGAPEAECARVLVPARWSEPTGPTIELFVKRWPLLERPSQAVWLLSGGPGESAKRWTERAPAMIQGLPEAQLYMLDHRGTGRSSRLTCPAQEDADSEGGNDITEAEWPGCLQHLDATWGSTLEGFSTTEAAHDLGQLIALTRTSSVIVFGESYGTYWLWRYLHLYPAQADGAMMNSLANPGFSFTTYNKDADEVGHALLDLCAEDPDCAMRLPAPREALSQAFESPCPLALEAGLDRARLQRSLFAMLQFGAPDLDLRAGIPALIYRLSQCRPQDRAAFQTFASLFGPSEPSRAPFEERESSEVLHHHVSLSELWIPDASSESQAEILERVRFAVPTLELEALQDRWPTYAKDPLADTFPQTSTPLAMFHGTLDAATAYKRAIAARARYPAQAFITVPGAPHGAIGAERTVDQSLCTVLMAMGFVTAPDRGVDSSCLENIAPVPLEPGFQISQLLFGSLDPWGDTLGAGAEAPQALRERFRRRLRALRAASRL